MAAAAGAGDAAPAAAAPAPEAAAAAAAEGGSIRAVAGGSGGSGGGAAAAAAAAPKAGAVSDMAAESSDSEEETEIKQFKVIVLGDGAVGKTSMLHRCVDLCGGTCEVQPAHTHYTTRLSTRPTAAPQVRVRHVWQGVQADHRGRLFHEARGAAGRRVGAAAVLGHWRPDHWLQDAAQLHLWRARRRAGVRHHQRGVVCRPGGLAVRVPRRVQGQDAAHGAGGQQECVDVAALAAAR